MGPPPPPAPRATRTNNNEANRDEESAEEEPRVPRKKVLSAMFDPSHAKDVVSDGDIELAATQVVEAHSARQCTICLEEIDDHDNKFSSTTCTHVYHRSCIMAWLTEQRRQHDDCPNCRTKLWTDTDYRATEDRLFEEDQQQQRRQEESQTEI